MARIDLTLQSIWTAAPLRVELASTVAYFSPSWPSGFECCPERPDGVYYPIVPGGCIVSPGFGDRVRCWYVRPRLRLPVGALVTNFQAFDVATPGSTFVAPNSSRRAELQKCPITMSSEPVWTIGNGQPPFTYFELYFPTTVADPAWGDLVVGTWAPFGIPQNAALEVRQKVRTALLATFATRRFHHASLRHPNSFQYDFPLAGAGLFCDTALTVEEVTTIPWLETRAVLPGPLSPIDYLDKATTDLSANVVTAAQDLFFSVVLRERYAPTPSVEMRSRFSLDSRQVGVAQTARIILQTRGIISLNNLVTVGPPCQGVCSVPVTAGAVELHSLSADDTVIDSADMSAGALCTVNPSPDGLYEVQMVGATWAAVPTFTVWQL